MANPFAQPIANKADTNWPDSRLMQGLPHIDGLLYAGAESLANVSANLVLTRNSAGYWSLNRTAAGGEAYNVRSLLSQMTFIRTGEQFNFGDYPSNFGAPPAKGFEVLDFFAVYQLGVADATAATLRLGKTVFANNTAPVQTDLVAATNIAKTFAGDATGPYVSTVTVTSPVFVTSDFTQVEMEFALALAITGTVKIVGLGAHINFNFN